MYGRCPFAVAVEQRADDAAVEHVVERGVVRLRRPRANELVALFEAADAQPFLVGRAAAEATVLWCVGLLNALHAVRILIWSAADMPPLGVAQAAGAWPPHST